MTPPPTRSLLPRSFLVACLLLVAACKAGPSAFDRTAGDDGPIDTAEAATLPTMPTARDVEVEGTPADSTPIRAAAPAGDSASLEVTEGSTAAAVIGPLGFERPAHVRGIYLNAWAAGSRKRSEQLIELARRTEINAFVIDIKDATGYVSHRTKVPMAEKIGATGEVRISDLPALLQRLKAEGIYPIARIVIVKDPLLSAAHPEWAIQTKAGGVFKDGKGTVWLNPYEHHVWEYEVALAREVAEIGFPEIQWDYIRFPDIPESEKEQVVYPGAGDLPKPAAIQAFLAYSRDQLAPMGVRVTADVFGVTTSVSRDVGIGQVWESFIGAVDVAQPMVYPSHYWEGSFGFKSPNAYPYEIVHRALSDALERSAQVEGAGATRPWLQDFTLGKPAFEGPEVRAQIQATYDVGIQEWILWNPGSHYTEAALKPEGGWAQEPTMRIANRIVPVSQRQVVLDSVEAVVAAAASAKQARRDAADSARARAAQSRADTVSASSTPGADSVGAQSQAVRR